MSACRENWETSREMIQHMYLYDSYASSWQTQHRLILGCISEINPPIQIRRSIGRMVLITFMINALWAMLNRRNVAWREMERQKCSPDMYRGTVGGKIAGREVWRKKHVREHEMWYGLCAILGLLFQWNGGGGGLTANRIPSHMLWSAWVDEKCWNLWI